MKCKDAVIKIVPSFYHGKAKELKRKQAYKEIKLWVNYGKKDSNFSNISSSVFCSLTVSHFLETNI
jgi:hypothetical protein